MSRGDLTIYDSPLGELRLRVEAGCLTGLEFGPWQATLPDLPAMDAADRKLLSMVREQLDSYFDHASTPMAFAGIPLRPEGTPFQKRVWNALQEIPYGETLSYGELARRIDQPTASRAVGMANGRNPISLIIPCHRVIGSQGQLVGYGGGIERKAWLLRWEGAIPSPTSGREID